MYRQTDIFIIKESLFYVFCLVQLNIHFQGCLKELYSEFLEIKPISQGLLTKARRFLYKHGKQVNRCCRFFFFFFFDEIDILDNHWLNFHQKNISLNSPLKSWK